MAKLPEDPASPVDDYEIGAVPSADPPPPSAPSSYSAAGSTPYAYGLPAQRTNVLAIISLIASCAGVIIPLAYVAGIIMGHISLAQIKRTGESGHGLALAGVIVGYSLLAISILVLVLYIIFIVVILGAAGSAGAFNSSNFG
jgi:hypothetical protein